MRIISSCKFVNFCKNCFSFRTKKTVTKAKKKKRTYTKLPVWIIRNLAWMKQWSTTNRSKQLIKTIGPAICQAYHRITSSQVQPIQIRIRRGCGTQIHGRTVNSNQSIPMQVIVNAHRHFNDFIAWFIFLFCFTFIVCVCVRFNLY